MIGIYWHFLINEGQNCHFGFKAFYLLSVSDAFQSCECFCNKQIHDLRYIIRDFHLLLFQKCTVVWRTFMKPDFKSLHVNMEDLIMPFDGPFVSLSNSLSINILCAVIFFSKYSSSDYECICESEKQFATAISYTLSKHQKGQFQPAFHLRSKSEFESVLPKVSASETISWC